MGAVIIAIRKLSLEMRARMIIEITGGGGQTFDVMCAGGPIYSPSDLDCGGGSKLWGLLVGIMYYG